MTSFDKLYKKYGAMLPPPPEEIVELPMPKPEKVPEIKELTPEEMAQWDAFIAEKKLLKDLDITKDVIDIGGEDKAEEAMGTIPAIPGKKKADLSTDALLKMCSKYHDLCHKF